MRNTLMRFGLVVVLVSAFVLAASIGAAQEVQDVAQEVQGVQVSIVEPPFRPPQEWSYDPIDVTATGGTTVTWTNTGAVVHTVTADDGISFDSGSLGSQEVFQFTPQTAGTFTYHCTFHPWMTGSVTVEP